MAGPNLLPLVCLFIFVTLVDKSKCRPIEVTGKNINYYKLTPNEGSGSYDFDYGTKDGAERSERGFIKREPGSDRGLLVVTGSFKYPDTNGDLYEVSYIADEQGYRLVPKEALLQVATSPTPTTERPVIKLNIVSTAPGRAKGVPCPPGKCSGARQSKIFVVKPYKAG